MAGRWEKETQLSTTRFWLGWIVIVALLAGPLTRLGVAAATGTPATSRPNVVVILTDDMRADDLPMMPHVRDLLVKQGMTFANSYVTTPVCCPSRASILRGQYAHNHGVLGNAGPSGGFTTFHALGREDSTVATWLHDAGYKTALVGKYLNGYPESGHPTFVPPGWDEWDALIGDSGKYFRFDLNQNGRVVPYAGRIDSSEQRRGSADSRSPDIYSTDVLATKATDFVQQAGRSGEPFFLYVAPSAPHGPADPAPRDATAFATATAPRPPSFNEANVDDKPDWVRTAPLLSADEIAQIDALYRDRLRSLLAVDDLVAHLVETLRATGTLDQTYIVFTSDNGYQLGEHRIESAKRAAYEESIRVPLVVRGPGIQPGAVVDQLALNIDLAPTIAGWADVAIPAFVDGRSLAPLLKGDAAGWRQAFLVEHLDSRVDRAEEGDNAPTVPTYVAVHTAGELYVEYQGGEREMYNLEADPYELSNIASMADRDLLTSLQGRLAQLRNCAGARCRTAEDAPFRQPAAPPSPLSAAPGG
jgi:N-acetylglucosamine-6-sulfatase